jgi:hypothetical protein
LKSPFKAVDATSSTAIFLVSIARFQHSPNQPLTQIPRGCTQRGKPQIKTKPTSYRGFTLINQKPLKHGGTLSLRSRRLLGTCTDDTRQSNKKARLAADFFGLQN